MFACPLFVWHLIKNITYALRHHQSVNTNEITLTIIMQISLVLAISNLLKWSSLLGQVDKLSLSLFHTTCPYWGPTSDPLRRLYRKKERLHYKHLASVQGPSSLTQGHSGFLMHVNEWIEIDILRSPKILLSQTYLSRFCFNLRPTFYHLYQYDGQCLSHGRVAMSIRWWTSHNLNLVLSYCVKAATPSLDYHSRLLHTPGDISFVDLKVVMASQFLWNL